MPDLEGIKHTLERIVADTAGAGGLVVGTGLGLSGPSGFDFGLSADFDNEESYLAYRHSAAHQRLLTETLIPAAEAISAIQLELGSPTDR